MEGWVRLGRGAVWRGRQEGVPRAGDAGALCLELAEHDEQEVRMGVYVVEAKAADRWDGGYFMDDWRIDGEKCEFSRRIFE